MKDVAGTFFELWPPNLVRSHNFYMCITGKILKLTIFYMGGGHNGPDDQRSSAVSLWIALRSPNFLTLFLSMFYKSQKSHFQKKKFLQKISNVVKNIHRGDPSMQKSKFSKKIFFFWKILFFLPEYKLYMISALFWGT